MPIFPEIEGHFFIDRVQFSAAKLEVFISERSQRVIFDYVRSFISFKESDLYQEIEKYELESILSVKNEDSLGVFRVISNPISKAFLHDRLEIEAPQFFFISTPDECMEIVSFELPTFYPQ